jgi:acetyl-CoA carboxylase carboxyl transferase subunit beta
MSVHAAAQTAAQRPIDGSGDGSADGPDAIGSAELRPIDAPPPPASEDPLGFPGYSDKLASARARGEDHEITVGTLTLGGEEAVVARGRFDALAGSMGRTHGSLIVAAMAHARTHRMPFVALISSGGARMQEGMLSLLQMARTAEGMRCLREAGIPAITYLGHPSTGGVFASYASLADVVLADPDATVGFAGPRVAESVTGAPVGQDSHTGRAAHASGLVDDLVGPGHARALLARWVGLLHPARRDGPLPSAMRAELSTVRLEATEVVARTRAQGRPSARSLMGDVFDDVLELSGDRSGGVDRVAIAAVARLGQRSVVVVGFDRDATNPHGRQGLPGSVGFRVIQRALAAAHRHRLPVVSFIDTRGADPSPDSESGGVASAIAETFVAMLSVDAPTVGVVTGEGGSGGALALGATDRLLIQDDAFFSVISPEGAATILYRDRERADEVVGHLRLRPHDLLELGLVDEVLPGPSTSDRPRAVMALRERISAAIAGLDADAGRMQRRNVRYSA